MNFRARLKRLLPPRAYNRLMLTLPALYKLPIVSYETNMAGDGGVEDLYELVQGASGRPGEIIECGSSRCGTSILIARQLRRLGVRKTVYALDSFEGFSKQELERERQLGLAHPPTDAFTSTSFEYVVEKLRKLGYEDSVVPVKGFFEDTLPAIARQSEFAFALVDCDLQESMRFCADTLWPRISPGGVLAFDDYNSTEFRGAKLAIDSFVNAAPPDLDSHGMLNRLYYLKKAN